LYYVNELAPKHKEWILHEKLWFVDSIRKFPGRAMMGPGPAGRPTRRSMLLFTFILFLTIEDQPAAMGITLFGR
jgi:hypothetical protein